MQRRDGDFGAAAVDSERRRPGFVAVPSLKLRKVRDNFTRAGKRNCAGLRGGTGRTQTVTNRLWAQPNETWPVEMRSHRYGTGCASAVTVASRGPVPSMYLAG
jgi:hypothetical protein